jgi:hypothetical protein
VQGIDDFFAPWGYGWWWWIVLPVFLVLLTAWILLSRRLAGRIGRPPKAVDLPTVWVPPKDAAKEALERIDATVSAARSGELDARDVHVELSAIIREYGWKRTGVDARSMTLDELRRSRLTEVADTIATFYPIAFAPKPGAEVEPAAERAREVVRTWS